MTAKATDDTTAEKHTGTVRNYRTVTVKPKRLQAYIGRDRVDGLAERTLSLHDTEGGVTLATEGADDGGAAGSLAELDALYQAAAEMEGGSDD